MIVAALAFVALSVSTASARVLPLVVAPSAAHSREDEFTCGFCEFLLFTIDTYLTEGSTEGEIAHVVDGICQYVPQEWTSTCTELIDELSLFFFFFFVRICLSCFALPHLHMPTGRCLGCIVLFRSIRVSPLLFLKSRNSADGCLAI